MHKYMVWVIEYTSSRGNTKWPFIIVCLHEKKRSKTLEVFLIFFFDSTKENISIRNKRFETPKRE